MIALSLIFGAIVGLSLGLTGGGGAIFAVPLLVYGLGLSPRAAVGTSLAAVGATALVGFATRWAKGQVEVPTGLLFSLAGMVTAPLGSWIAGRLPDTVLLVSFAGLMIVVAVRLWLQTKERPLQNAPENRAAACRRDASGALLLTSRCATLLMFAGLLTGLLSGMFGVGGGFVIVPALVLASGMPIHRAVGTSLLAITLISASGVAAHAWAGRDIETAVTGLFVLGGAGGLLIGQAIARRLSPTVLQRVFVVAMLAVAMFVLARNLV